MKLNIKRVRKESPDFSFAESNYSVKALNTVAGSFFSNPNKFAALASCDDLVQFHGSLNQELHSLLFL